MFDSHLLKHVVSWERQTSADAWGTVGHEDPVNIPAFKTARTREVTGPGGLEIHSIWEIATLEEVLVGDKLDGQVVQGVAGRTSLDGETVGYISTTE